MAKLHAELDGIFRPEHSAQVDEFAKQVLLARGEVKVSPSEGEIHVVASWTESLELMDMAKHLETLHPGHVKVAVRQG